MGSFELENTPGKSYGIGICNVAIIGLTVYLIVAGPGPFSLDGGR